MVDNQFDDMDEVADEAQWLVSASDDQSFEDTWAYPHRNGLLEKFSSKITKNPVPMSRSAPHATGIQYLVVSGNHDVKNWWSHTIIRNNFDLSFERALTFASKAVFYVSHDVQGEIGKVPGADFEPSDALLKLTGSNTDDEHANMILAGSNPVDHFAASERAVEMKDIFTSKMYGLFAMLGYRAQDNIETTGLMSSSGHFVLPLQYTILAHFDIIPYNSKDFLLGFYSEIIDFLANGGEISGDWGSIALAGRDICLVPSADRIDEGPSSWMTALER